MPDGPAIVRINLFVRSIMTISDIKMVSSAKQSCHQPSLTQSPELSRLIEMHSQDPKRIRISLRQTISLSLSLSRSFEVSHSAAHAPHQTCQNTPRSRAITIKQTSYYNYLTIYSMLLILCAHIHTHSHTRIHTSVSFIRSKIQ